MGSAVGGCLRARAQRMHGRRCAQPRPSTDARPASHAAVEPGAHAMRGPTGRRRRTGRSRRLGGGPGPAPWPRARRPPSRGAPGPPPARQTATRPPGCPAPRTAQDRRWGAPIPHTCVCMHVCMYVWRSREGDTMLGQAHGCQRPTPPLCLDCGARQLLGGASLHAAACAWSMRASAGARTSLGASTLTGSPVSGSIGTSAVLRSGAPVRWVCARG